MTQLIPISLHFLAGLFGAFGQLFYKKGGLLLGAMPIWKNWQLFSGIFCFCIVMGLFVLSYKLGGRISLVYPAYATTFIWGTLIGQFLENEPVQRITYFGVFLILLGVAAIGMGSIRQ